MAKAINQGRCPVWLNSKLVEVPKVLVPIGASEMPDDHARAVLEHPSNGLFLRGDSPQVMIRIDADGAGLAQKAADPSPAKPEPEPKPVVNFVNEVPPPVGAGETNAKPRGRRGGRRGAVKK